MMAIKISDGATPMLQALLAKLHPTDVANTVGYTVKEMTVAHLKEYDANHPNKFGASRTHYYKGAADGTSLTVGGDTATISVNQTGILQRIYGGKIVPKNAKYLTIPANAQAYAKKARDFPNLVPLIRRKNGVVRAVALAEATTTPLLKGFRKSGEIRRGKVTVGRVYFWLVLEVNQIGEPGIVPSREKVEQCIQDSLITSSKEEMESIKIIEM